MAAIEVTGLGKNYGDVLAIDDLTFEVAEGEIFGYLGPNGAGKTTTIRTLMGFLSPTAGKASVLGHDVTDETELVEAKRRIGYLPGDPAFDEGSTGTRILDLHESIKGGARREELLTHFDPPLDRTVREYSRGNIQKLGLVQAFMHDPDLVMLDEPTSGLDPLMQQEFNEFVRTEREAGTTVFMSSHVLSEVRQVCDRVGIIRNGRLVTVQHVEDLLDRGGKVVRFLTESALEATDVDLAGTHDLSIRDVDGGTEVSFTYTGGFDELVSVLSGLELLDLDVEDAPLEDVFSGFYDDGRDVTGSPLREEPDA